MFLRLYAISPTALLTSNTTNAVDEVALGSFFGGNQARMAQSLTSCDIPDVSFATDAFGEDKGLLICRPGRSPCLPFFSIPEGCYALVTRHGADVDYEGSAVWPAGFHPGFPWLKVSNLVTKQSLVFDMPVKGCKTRDNVSVQIDVAIIFRIMGDQTKNEDPSLVRTFVHEVGARGLEQQLRGAQEEEVRALARTMKHTQVYGLRSRGTRDHVQGVLHAMEEGGEGDSSPFPGYPGDPTAEEAAVLEGQYDAVDAYNAADSTAKGTSHCEKMKASLNRQFQPQGVMITAVIIKNVELPTNIREQMSGKTFVISSQAEQKMNQQSDMQQISYDQEVDTLNQAHFEQREEEKQSAEQKSNEIQIRLGNLKAEAMKTKSRIEEDNAVTVKQIKADVELQDAVVTEMRVNSERQAAKIRAETSVFVTQKESEASLSVAQNAAEAKAILTDAEGKIAPMLAAVKCYQTKQLQLGVAAALAENPDLIISSSSNEEVNAMMMCDAVLHTMTPGEPLNRSQVLAELVMLQKGSRVYMSRDMNEPPA